LLAKIGCYIANIARFWGRSCGEAVVDFRC
jgi:hypothetical protein